MPLKKYIEPLLLCGLLLHVSLSVAEVDSENPKDRFYFSAGLASIDASLRRVVLDAEMIEVMQHARAGDVRVYDAMGIEMPAMVRTSKIETDEQYIKLKFFPLYADKGHGREKSVKIERDVDGNVISIRSLKQTVATSNEITGYILDQSDNEDLKLSSLKLQWQQDALTEVVHLKVETSDDLRHWRRLNGSAVIAMLEFSNNILTRDTVTISGSAKKYIKISLSQPVKSFKLKNVEAIYNQKKETDYHWISLGKMKKSDDKIPSYLFETKSGVSPVRMMFDLQGRTAMFFGEIYAFKNKGWVIRNHSVSQYHVTQGDLELKSKPMYINGLHDWQYKYVPGEGETVSDAFIPEVKLAYQHYELIFNAQGSEPYTLAWGNPYIFSQRSSIGNIVKLAEASNNSIVKVNILNRQQNNAVAERETDKIDWKKMILWAVLVLGVAGAGRMAYSLMKEVNSTTAD